MYEIEIMADRTNVNTSLTNYIGGERPNYKTIDGQELDFVKTSC